MSPLTAWWNPWRTRPHPWAGGAGPPPSTTPCPSTCSTSSSVPAGRGTPSWYSTGKSSAAKWPSPSRPTSSTATRRPRPQRRGVYIQPEVFLGPEGSDTDWPWEQCVLQGWHPLLCHDGQEGQPAGEGGPQAGFLRHHCPAGPRRCEPGGPAVLRPGGGGLLHAWAAVQHGVLREPLRPGRRRHASTPERDSKEQVSEH